MDLFRFRKHKGCFKSCLKWEAAYGKEYNIQVSEDGNVWETVAVENNGDGDSDTLSFKHINARFVKMQGIKRALGYGYSLYEFEVY